MVTKTFVGQRFGKLILVRRASTKPLRWFCRCDCGKDTTVRSRTEWLWEMYDPWKEW